MKEKRMNEKLAAILSQLNDLDCMIQKRMPPELSDLTYEIFQAINDISDEVEELAFNPTE
jgi:hypothetical protein